jgi:hypothetical protein
VLEAGSDASEQLEAGSTRSLQATAAKPSPPVNVPKCFKRSNPVPYQLCDPTECNSASGVYSTFATCCKSWTPGFTGVLKGDGRNDYRCQLAPGRAEPPCWTPNKLTKQCTVSTDANDCLNVAGYTTQVSRRD